MSKTIVVTAPVLAMIGGDLSASQRARAAPVISLRGYFMNEAKQRSTEHTLPVRKFYVMTSPFARL